RKVQRTYLTLLLLNTLAASLIWGINTLFLLDAGLSNTEAFAANAFFTLGFMIFEIPTGVVADLRGRRTSYLLGVITLILSTLLYLLMWYRSAPFWGWVLSSMLLGLGFTFFSGAVEAWLVDALAHSGFKEQLESVLAKGEIVEGAAMLTGSVAGGIVAQATTLGVPYVIRAALLVLNFVFAFLLMRDLGFKPADEKNPIKEVKIIIAGSIRHGLRNPPVRWIMLAAPFTGGVTIYAFYAMQPYLLQLWGDERAYGVAGLAAAIVAGAQIAGGLLVPQIGRIFRRRTTLLVTGEVISVLVLAIVGFVPNFWVAVTMLILWGLMFSAMMPVRQTYLNGLIPSEQRATVLSFDSLFSSSGGVVFQPLLGKAADVWSYPTSYIFSSAIQALALPFTWLARREKAASDAIRSANGGKDETKLAAIASTIV
ncbi:MAG TPA: MFS transporter, partial [Pyrinomonadaceae bacterium]|nr:MFS transporter [Pyrinomonadaceae bacterium]